MRVEPIREDEWVVAFADYLKSKSERNYIMFMIGVYTGLRISDILPLRVADVMSSHMVLIEKKTKKQKRIILHPTLKKALSKYIEGKKRTTLLIPSRHRTKAGREKPISRRQALHILQEAAVAVGYEEPIGTHSLRKTFGFRHYQQYKDVAELQIIFNHDSQYETLKYIGVMSERIERGIVKMKDPEGLLV
ncbi:Tyrosine recombinase XerC [Metalysinibacillus saudimassiliensis]|uniref:Tyrosine recombinase XerC n=1 Tax=Metalysinibacillus saudimassiliensis TaxID=1461583 RepID=A0A078MHG6_9BACL|nr:Tyrosine recombinase XerC [Metalysinibacillus saudimassiliensis]